jgi:hypothetical protein
MSTFAVFDDESSCEIVMSDFLERSDDTPLKAIPINIPDRTVIHSAQNGFWAAYLVMKSVNYINESMCFAYQFKESVDVPVIGNSAGLGFCLKLVQETQIKKTGKDLGYSMAATGVLSDGTEQALVKKVNGMGAKFTAAIHCMKRGDYFFYPSDNEIEITQEMREDSVKLGIRLIPVSTAREAILALIERPSPRKKHYPLVIAALMALTLLVGLRIWWKPPLKAAFDLIPSSQTQSLNGELLIIPSGGGFRTKFEAQNDCYAYIFQMDSHNNLKMLFPSPEVTGARNPLDSGKAYQFPKGDDWFILDRATGPEKVLALASRRPLVGLQEAFSRFDGAPVRAEKDRYREDLIRRLEKGRRDCPAGLEGYLRGNGCFYKELVFWHE